MITKNQLLQAPESELPRILGEIFKLYDEHDFNHVVSGNRICRACGIRYHDDLLGEICKIPLPIGITDWNVAMRFRDRAVEKHGDENWSIAKAEASGIKHLDLKYSFDQLQIACRLADQFYSTKAQPRHYLVAAAVCEIRDDPSA